LGRLKENNNGIDELVLFDRLFIVLTTLTENRSVLILQPFQVICYFLHAPKASVLQCPSDLYVLVWSAQQKMEAC